MSEIAEQHSESENDEPGNNGEVDVKSTEEGTSEAQSTNASNIEAQSAAFRPPTRVERRNLWLKEYGEQDFALQMWVRLVEQHDLDVEMMFQMHGMLVFGVMVSTAHYAQFYIELNEELHRDDDPDTADALHEYYTALIPPPDQPEIGTEGLPIIYRCVHMRDVTIMSAGHKIKVPYWRGLVSQVDAFVIGATPGE
ncbi:MAG TPA: hypothetical protein VKP04_01700 [Ktedonobacteraceae bacterium]|nr:hypothetical protein [Ktedonobacteraceae bacterium]